MFSNMINIYSVLGLIAGVLAFVALMLAFKWRTVVDTNKVHIVQSNKKTTSYGSEQKDNGNVYYAIPSYIPYFGVTRIILPINNFNIDLNDYKAYDKDRVPFIIHVTSFFRIKDTNVAAARISSFEELKQQLEQVVKGAVRKILASCDIHKIMTDRAAFGQQFTEEVATELLQWGVEPVKNMELMDIRDVEKEGSNVIANIMAQKSSQIEMESRTVVAANKQKAKTAEIEAERTIQMSSIEAKRITELSGIEAKQAIEARNVEQERVVGISRQKATQEIQKEAVVTKQKEMEVKSVEVQRAAEIAKEAALVKADQDAAVLVKIEDGKLGQAKLHAESVKVAAEGNLRQTLLEAEGTQKMGEAKAAAEKALQLAPVESQIVLAKEIGGNDGYQKYLISIRKVEADQAVGIAQAEALKQADIKVIANTGSASQGISSLGELLSSKGGQQVGAFLEGLTQTDVGAKTLGKVVQNGNGAAS